MCSGRNMPLNDIKNARFEKFKAIQKAGFNPFPGGTKRTHEIKSALENFGKLSKSKKFI